MHHTIKRDLVDDGSDLRNRSTRNSFRQAVDRSYEAGSEETSQRGVDGELGVRGLRGAWNIGMLGGGGILSPEQNSKAWGGVYQVG